MKKFSRGIVFSAYLIFLLVLPAHAELEITPLDYDFGYVQVGTSSTATITITDHEGGHQIFAYWFSDTGGLKCNADFGYCVSGNIPHGYIMHKGESLHLEITYSPSPLGPRTATLDFLILNDGLLTQQVRLRGFGVEELTLEARIANILAFFDQSVSHDRLWGSGPGASADSRLNALINMIESAGYLIVEGDYQGARALLSDAHFKTDGEPIPVDFVAGSDASVLASVIMDLLETLPRE